MYSCLIPIESRRNQMELRICEQKLKRVSVLAAILDPINTLGSTRFLCASHYVNFCHLQT